MSLDDKDLSTLIREHATRHKAPETLRAGIRTQIALEEARRTPPPPRRPWLVTGWGTASAGFALGMLCMGLLLPLGLRLGSVEPLDADLVAGHVRALRVGPIAEVLSTDRHTVKPWFQGKLDYAPPVFDLASEGYALTGGRIEHVRGEPVGVLIFNHNRHVIDLFVWPSTDRAEPQRTVRRGFNVVHWADGSMQYWAVSDTDRHEMENFVRLWQARAAAQ